MSSLSARSLKSGLAGQSRILSALLAGSALLAVAPQTVCAQTLPIEVPEDEMLDLGTLGGNYGYAYDVSDDGLVVIGHSRLDEIDYYYRAFRWTADTGMEDLGTLGGDYSYARAVSGDGSTIVGHSYLSSNSNYHAFRWTEADGMVDLGTLGGDWSYAYAVNTDGSVVVGQSNTIGNANSHAFRWTETDGMADLGTLGGNYSYAYAVDGSGDVVVGQSNLAGDSYYHAFRWTEADGMVDLGTLGGNWSYAYDVSRDGSTVVGQSNLVNDGNSHAFRWTEETGMVGLGTLGGDWSYARAVSNDGSAIVGNSRNVEDTNTHAFLWTEEGGMRDLGTLGGEWSYGEDISGDGAVATGYSALETVTNGEDSYTPYHAFRWTEEDGMTDLGTLGGNHSYAYAISNDGSTIVGEAQTEEGYWHPFIYRTQMQDFTNMIASFPIFATDLEAIGETQRESLAWMLDNGCSVADGRSVCVAVNGALGRSKASDGWRLNKRRDEQFHVSLGLRLTPALSVGGGVGVFQQRRPFYMLEADEGVSVDAWINFAPGGDSRLGPKLHAAIGKANQDVDTMRGLDLEDVEVLTARSELKTLMASARAGYGIDAGPLVLTPFAAISWQRTQLAAFDEPEGDFPASFARTRWDTSFATLGAEAAIPLGAKGWFTLAGMADFDLESDAVVVSGISEIPGMEAFTVASLRDRKKTRGRFEAGVSQQFGVFNVSLKGSLRAPSPHGRDNFVIGLGVGVDL